MSQHFTWLINSNASYKKIEQGIFTRKNKPNKNSNKIYHIDLNKKVTYNIECIKQLD
ncbi:SH3 domain-containing protein [Providencia manganoxydans]|uniref:SH3 domain-containing protein n=1 Tax=Providencia manganoxydans TaxID=2923283 RepID=UPI0034E3D8CE